MKLNELTKKGIEKIIKNNSITELITEHKEWFFDNHGN